MQTKSCEMGQEIHTFSLRVHNGSEKRANKVQKNGVPLFSGLKI